MNDLISRLRARLAAEKAVRETGHNAADREQAELIRLLTNAAAALEEAREDAERWRHARKLLTIDDIEGAQGAYESFGRLISEDECKRADAAIDQARGKEVAE